ncbi:hypothetical protein K7X08_031906 [Anisodus acutangulus]|uniref:Cytochrome P450 n=1 Tax=Anisodus acutangulus TaxID=402998 RepID=A0A9Q1MN29_9SOLA|nr:hypothetical protein K7X08_031906 [Anisodus acutangulus]
MDSNCGSIHQSQLLPKITSKDHLHESLEREQERIFIPLIKAQMKAKTNGLNHHEEEVVAYADTLLNLEFPEEKRKFNDGEIVSLCSEFLTGGTETTSTSLQWIMANLVKYPSIQEKLYQEISEVVNRKNSKPKGVEEEDVEKMSYLKAVILEGLRRHPPGHFLQPHTVTEEVELNGYVIPKDATINFMTADMNLDPKVWENPLDFKPDREKSMSSRIWLGYAPFGVLGANLIWHFEWRAVDGNGVDLSSWNSLLR